MKLISFPTGRSVLLEQPRKSGSKVISHMLSSHGGEIFLHVLSSSRSILEDPPSISEGCGGRVTDYRITVRFFSFWFGFLFCLFFFLKLLLMSDDKMISFTHDKCVKEMLVHFSGELEWIAWSNCFSLYYWYIFSSK